MDTCNIRHADFLTMPPQHSDTSPHIYPIMSEATSVYTYMNGIIINGNTTFPQARKLWNDEPASNVHFRQSFFFLLQLDPPLSFFFPTSKQCIEPSKTLSPVSAIITKKSKKSMTPQSCLSTNEWAMWCHVNVNPCTKRQLARDLLINGPGLFWVDNIIIIIIIIWKTS